MRGSRLRLIRRLGRLRRKLDRLLAEQDPEWHIWEPDENEPWMDDMRGAHERLDAAIGKLAEKEGVVQRARAERLGE